MGLFEENYIEHRAYARVGLLGNPSDVYYGRTLSFGLANFWATARLRPSQDLVIEPHPYHDLVQFNSLDHLVTRVENEGYYGGVRLLMATCKMFFRYCIDHKIDLKSDNFTLSYDTNIPRQTGLSGSSAIVCAALNCLLDFYSVRHLVKVEERPNLILSAEGELGITAGLQDRVAQVYGGVVYMDFKKEYMDKETSNHPPNLKFTSPFRCTKSWAMMTSDSSHYSEKSFEEHSFPSKSALNGAAITEGAIVEDAVFGAIGEDGPNYRALGWCKAAVLLVKAQLGLGVLGIPSVFNTLGVLPGLIAVLGIGALTTWSDWVVGQFKLTHPEVFSIADVGFLLAGKPGREILGTAYWLYMVSIAASGYLSLSIAFNAISSHATCSVAFTFVAAVGAGLLASIQTLGKIGFLGWVGLTSILGALFTLVVAVCIEDRPSAAPPTGHWDKDLKLVGSPSFVEAMSAISTVVFAYAATPGFFNVAAEMRKPRDFTKSVLSAQALVTVVYIVVGIVVWWACGQYVASPALGSAGLAVKKAAYGVALPALFVSSLLFTHLPAKYLFVRALQGSKHLTQNTFKHWAVWLGCVFGGVTFSFVFGSAVPVFNNLVSLIGALLGTVMSMQTMGLMWLFDHSSDQRTTKHILLYAFNVFLIIVGTFIMIGGTYAAAVDIKTQVTSGTAGSPFSCADNSGPA